MLCSRNTWFDFDEGLSPSSFFSLNDKKRAPAKDTLPRARIIKSHHQRPPNMYYRQSPLMFTGGAEFFYLLRRPSE